MLAYIIVVDTPLDAAHAIRVYCMAFMRCTESNSTIGKYIYIYSYNHAMANIHY